jgi:hypothetical protein
MPRLKNEVTAWQIHQIGAADIQHRRHQQRQLLALRLAPTGKTALQIRRNRLGQNLDPTHAKTPLSSKAGSLNHTPTHDVNKTDPWQA